MTVVFYDNVTHSGYRNESAWSISVIVLMGDNASTPEEHLSQCYYVHHKPHKDKSGIEPGRQT